MAVFTPRVSGMANTLREFLVLLHLVTLVCCITTTDKKEELKVKDVDAEDNKDDLDPQETGWIFNPLQEKARTLEYLKEKVLYPFSALKSPGESFGGGFPIYHSGSSNTYNPGSYPSYSFAGSGSYFPSPKPKQYNYYNPGYTPYKQSYPSYPHKTWYNKNYYSSGGYQSNTATYAPGCFYPSAGPALQPPTTSPPTYSSGTPINYYYSSAAPSQTYGVPGVNFGSKSEIGFSSTPAPISYSSHYQPSTDSQSPPSSYIWRISSSPQYLDGSSQISGLSPSFPSVPSLPSPPAPSSGFSSSTFSLPSVPTAPSLPTTPSPPFSSPTPPSTIVSTTPTPNIPSYSNSITSVPPSIPIPVFYSQGDEGIAQEVIITPPPPHSKSHYVSTLPGKVALPESPYQYNQPPSYAVAYYPNVFYITNEQRLEKTSSTQSVSGAQDVPSDGTADDSSGTSTTSDSQSTTSDESPPSTKSQSSVQTLPGPGVSMFYTSQTLDQTRIPVPYNPGQLVFPQPQGGFYSPVVPNAYSGQQSGGGVSSYQVVSQAAPAPLTDTISTLSYPLPLSYTYGQSPIAYQITRTSKNC